MKTLGHWWITRDHQHSTATWAWEHGKADMLGVSGANRPQGKSCMFNDPKSIPSCQPKAMAAEHRKMEERSAELQRKNNELNACLEQETTRAEKACGQEVLMV
jgi:hypothetical protein